MSETIVLITGSNQGLGYEVVKKLAAENESYRILLCSRNLQNGQEAAAEVTSLGKNTSIDVIQLDVTSDDSIGEAVKKVEQKCGRVDVLFNNAGIASAKGSQREAMRQIYEVNCVSVVAVTEAFLPLLKKSEIPRIVIMSSDLGSITYTVDPSHYAHFYQEYGYKASKAAANMIGAIASVKYKDDGIKVNLVNPGFRATNLNGHSEHAGEKSGGAIEACRVITLGDKGDRLSYTEIEGSIHW